MTDLRTAAQMALHAMHSAREFLAIVEDPRARLQEKRLHDAMQELHIEIEEMTKRTEESLAVVNMISALGYKRMGIGEK